MAVTHFSIKFPHLAHQTVGGVSHARSNTYTLSLASEPLERGDITYPTH